MTSFISDTCTTLLDKLRKQWDYATAGVLADAFFDAEDPYNAALWYVLANPADDTRRLAYAAECEPRDAARAEFVRVQVELAKIGECPVCDGKGEFPNSSMQIPIQRCWICYDLRRRERELEKEAIRWVEEMLDKGINNGAG